LPYFIFLVLFLKLYLKALENCFRRIREYQKKDVEVTLEEIIETYANPKAQRDLSHLKG
jgi:hypothetical protein